MKTNIETLSQLVEAIEQHVIDVAPSYQEYVNLAFAIANSVGEEGRSYFHRICRLSVKYDANNAEAVYNSALKKGQNKNGLGTLIYYMERAGINMKQHLLAYAQQTPWEQNPQKTQKTQKTHSKESLTHTRVPYYIEGEEENEENTTEECTDTTIECTDHIESCDPITPLPTFPAHQWPDMLMKMMDCAANSDAQRDILLLTGFAVLGAAVAPYVHTHYFDKRIHSSQQLIVVGKPASGKGVIGFVRDLVKPIHQELRNAYTLKYKEYEQAMSLYNSLGKEKGTRPTPEKPLNQLFLIPGNNTGTGIMQNIIDSGGTGLIFESEADTIISSIHSDFGNFSDVIRKIFDHDGLSYNRRGNGGEYREITETLVGIILSGTPEQFKDLVKSPENGNFSRLILYYLPAVPEWINPFQQKTRHTEQIFRQLGREWLDRYHQLQHLGKFTLVLSDEQQQAFNQVMQPLNTRAQVVSGADMPSSVRRLGINLVRMMEVTAILRMLEAYTPDGSHRVRQLPHCRPASDVSAENQKDGLISHWELTLADDDFQAILRLAVPLYEHTVHLLSYLNGSHINRIPLSEKDRLFDQMPDTFTRQQYLDAAIQMNINPHTAATWLERTLKSLHPTIVCTGKGTYTFTLQHRKPS